MIFPVFILTIPFALSLCPPRPSIDLCCSSTANMCKSEYGYCGVGEDYCGEGCQCGACWSNTTSANGIYGTTASNCSRVTENFNGAKLKHFKLDYCGKQFSLTQGNGNMRMTKECGTRVSSLQFFKSGYFEAGLRIAKGNGAVTAFILRSDETTKSDEIDLEFVGGSTNWTMFNHFADSVPDYSHARWYEHGYDASEKQIRVAIKWDANQTVWYVDGDAKYNISSDNPRYPKRPMQVQVGIWDGTNTGGWAGTVDYNQGPFMAHVDYITMQTDCP